MPWVERISSLTKYISYISFLWCCDLVEKQSPFKPLKNWFWVLYFSQFWKIFPSQFDVVFIISTADHDFGLLVLISTVRKIKKIFEKMYESALFKKQAVTMIRQYLKQFFWSLFHSCVSDSSTEKKKFFNFF